MAKKNKQKNKQQAQATNPEAQARKEAQAQKKEFIKSIMKAERLVAFVGDNNVVRFGFSSDGDLLLFLLDQVYGWDGKNETFQSVLQRIQEMATAAQGPEEDEADELLKELESEDAAKVLEVSSDDEGDDEDGDEVEDGDNDEASAEVIPIKKEDNEELAELKAKLAVFEEERKK